MAKKKDHNEVIKTGVLKEHPEFKPGNKPYCQFGKDILNKNVPWTELVTELMFVGFNKKTIAEYAECPVKIIEQILANNHKHLSFRSGARIVALHYHNYPGGYLD